MPYTFRYTSVAYIQAKTGLSNTDVDLTNDTIVRMIGEDSEDELELLTGRKFGDASALTEFFSTKDKSITDQYATTVQVSCWPIQSITEAKILDLDGNATSTFTTLSSASIAAGTYETDDYWLEITLDPVSNTMVPSGRLILKTVTIPKGTNNVKIGYTYGYSSVPVPIRNLATVLAAMRLWTRFLGGNYGAITAYSIPQQSVTKGDLYDRGAKQLEMLRAEADTLLDRIGRRGRTLFYATGNSR